MYMLEGFRLKCVFTSINDSFFSLFVEFLVPKQETFGIFTFVFSIKFIKSVVSLRCVFCDYDIGCSNVPVSTKEEVLSVRPSDES